MKLKMFILISIVTLILFGWANYASWEISPAIDDESVQGKKVWQKHNCVSCHTIFGNGGYVGQDLTHITGKRTREELMKFFTEPPVIPPSKEKKHPGLTKAEATSLIKYFEYLNQIPTLGWPPAVSNYLDGREK